MGDDPLLSSLVQLLAGPQMFATWLLRRVSQPGSSLLPEKRWSRDRETDCGKWKPDSSCKRHFCSIPSVRWSLSAQPTPQGRALTEGVGVYLIGCLPRLLPVLVDSATGLHTIMDCLCTAVTSRSASQRFKISYTTAFLPPLKKLKSS